MIAYTKTFQIQLYFGLLVTFDSEPSLKCYKKNPQKNNTCDVIGILAYLCLLLPPTVLYWRQSVQISCKVAMVYTLKR